MKKVLVCLKQVPNTRDVNIDPEDHTLIREGVDSILNPYDDCALEEALILKRNHGIKVGTMTMGPPQATDVLEYSLKRGSDEAHLLTDSRLAGSDTWATAIAIVSLIKKIGYENIFCGQESIDSGTGHIGSSIAELLNVPHVNCTKRITGFEKDRLKIFAKFDKCDATLEVVLPAVISFLKKEQDTVFEYSKKADISKIKEYSVDDLKLDPKYVGLEGSFTQIVNIDIDERFVGYVTIDSNLSADERIKAIADGGITEKKDRKVMRDLNRAVLKEISGLIRLKQH